MAATSDPGTIQLQCPSAQPDMAGACVFGILDGDVGALRTAYIDSRIPATSEVIELTGDVDLRKVYRFAAA
jgi:hypothetical protein